MWCSMAIFYPRNRLLSILIHPTAAENFTDDIYTLRNLSAWAFCPMRIFEKRPCLHSSLCVIYFLPGNGVTNWLRYSVTPSKVT